MKVLKRSTLIPTNIIEQCVAKNRAAQREFYDILIPYLSSVCRRYLRNSSDLEDVLQETFISIFTNIDQFDPQKGTIKTWAVKVAVNCSLKMNQKMYKLNTTEFNSETNQEAVAPSVYSELSNEEIIDLLKKMPVPWYEVFNMYIVEGYSHEEIGLMLDIDKALSRQRLSRARKWVNERYNSGSLMSLELKKIS